MTNDSPRPNKVLIIGLGEIGYNNAKYMATRGLEVHGFDIRHKAIERAISDGVITQEAESFAGYNYYIICISTHNPADIFAPYADGIFEIARRIAREGESGALVGIDSTIPRGTSKKVSEILKRRLNVVHVPHRYFAFEKKEHGVCQRRIIGAVDERSMIEGLRFYGEILGIPLHQAGSTEVAELCKIVENSYRFLEIAFSEELKMICDNSGIDFNELRMAVNTKWNIKILEAREGIGGHCLPKDSEMFLGFSRGALESSIIDAAKMIDRKYRSHIGRRSVNNVPGLVRRSERYC